MYLFIYLRLYFFTIRLGQSSGGSCRYPTSTAEGVVFQYSNVGGMTWTTIRTFAYASYRSPTQISGYLPADAMTKATRFRWMQTSNSGANYDAWAIDDVSIIPLVAAGYIADDFTSATPDGITNSPNWLLLRGITVGNGKDVCSSSNGKALVYNSTSVVSYLQAAPILVLSSVNMYMIQFDLVMKCGYPYSRLNPIDVQFNATGASSSNGWKYARQSCLPLSNCPNGYSQQSSLSSEEYTSWKRVTIPLGNFSA